MNAIQMVDLTTQYQHFKEKIDEAIARVVSSGVYIGGMEIATFENQLARYLNVKQVITCANGTDALTVALMSLGLEQGDEVITSSFSFIATAEAIALLKLKPVFADIEPTSFNISPESIRRKITPKTRAIIPVHLFGQACAMDEIMEIAQYNNLYVIEDNAQSLGATHPSGVKIGTMGHIGCTSFFPSKNLGCMGDGGAVFTNDEFLAARIRRVVHHGSDRKYHHSEIGINSRLDALQAAILRVKLGHLDQFNKQRQEAALFYSNALKEDKILITPQKAGYSNHIFHQYTIRVKNGERDQLQQYLQQNGVPSAIYYPVPLHLQKVFEKSSPVFNLLPESEQASKEVLSLPMHTELSQEQLRYITDTIHNFYSISR